MKRTMGWLLILMLALTAVLSAQAEAEEYDRVSPEALALYDSEWRSEDFSLDIIPQDGELKVQILHVTEYPQGYCWEYSTQFNGETKKLEAVRPAVKFSVAWREEGGYDLTGTLYEETVEASFEINEEGKLLWHDGKEDAGKDAAFDKIGRFDGTAWQSGRALIEMYYEEEGYKVLIRWGSSAWETTEWEYSCFYDPEANTLLSLPFGIRTEAVYNEDGTVASWTEVYNDGEAEFFLDDEGYLIWQDQKEDAGKDMRFEQVERTEPQADDPDSNG